MLVAAQAPRARKDAHAVTDTRQAHVIATTICYQFKGGGGSHPHERCRTSPSAKIRSDQTAFVLRKLRR
jgi:hypothetical protein